MKYKGRKFTKSQLQFVVEVMIVAAVDHVTNVIPGRFIDGKSDDSPNH